MKGKILSFVKKWWVLVLVMALAMSLTSCSKRRRLLNESGFACDGSLGLFNVYIYPAGDGLFTFEVEPLQLAVAGPIIQVGIVNQTTNAFDVKIQQAAAQPNVSLFSTVTYNDLFNYDIVAIRPANGGFFNDWSQVPVDAACYMIPPENLIPGNGNVN